MKIVSRQEAIKKGLTRYYTGKPCPKGHDSERFVSGHNCVRCIKSSPAYKRGSARKAKKWAANNPEKKKQMDRDRYNANPQEYIDRARKWDRAHPEVRSASRHRRRARLAKAEGRYAPSDIDKLFKDQAGKCFCGVYLFAGFHIDHMTPLSRGGSNWPSNLQLLCAPCNIHKGTKTMEEWLALVA